MKGTVFLIGFVKKYGLKEQKMLFSFEGIFQIFKKPVVPVLILEIKGLNTD